MVEVERHKTYPNASKRAIRQLAEDVAEGVEKVQRYSDALNLQFLAAQSLLGHRTVVDPRGAERETWLALRTALDTGAAVFTVAAAEKGALVRVRLGDETVTASGTGPVYYSTAENWLTTLWLAVVARDQAVLDTLTAFPLDVLRASGSEPAYLVDMVRLFQLFFRREDGVGAALGAALSGSTPGALGDGEERETADLLRFPQLTLVHYLLKDDAEAEFNDALAEALRAHNTYWSKTEERRASPVGYLALGPLALATIAQDAGTTIAVTSDYLPAALLDGTTRVENG
ncbi:immunity 49 family protein [Saccharothrix variisporea]|uniref:Immunity protein 49 of polymorphic toxin system n=1 Tax=Saccharothrix variisporea TaxID=543527 RepID=A0A495XQ36_9PSEU|nr:immunity 49 family protein [Saccharothrix variisporea]RKT73768.1 immunity protein 49 of polymorphic toxin system [Saccharothrix variisporea]